MFWFTGSRLTGCTGVNIGNVFVRNSSINCDVTWRTTGMTLFRSLPKRCTCGSPVKSSSERWMLGSMTSAECVIVSRSISGPYRSLKWGPTIELFRWKLGPKGNTVRFCRKRRVKSAISAIRCAVRKVRLLGCTKKELVSVNICSRLGVIWRISWGRSVSNFNNLGS